MEATGLAWGTSPSAIAWDARGRFGGNRRCEHCGSPEVVARMGSAHFCARALADALAGWSKGP